MSQFQHLTQPPSRAVLLRNCALPCDAACIEKKPVDRGLLPNKPINKLLRRITMAWQVLRCRDTGNIWLWERPNPPGVRTNIADNMRHLIPTENTRQALYGQYPVVLIESEASLISIPIGRPRGTWKHSASRDPMQAQLFERGL